MVWLKFLINRFYLLIFQITLHNDPFLNQFQVCIFYNFFAKHHVFALYLTNLIRNKSEFDSLRYPTI